MSKTKKVSSKKAASKPVHAIFGSPSGLYALKECPGKVLFGKDIPNPPASEHALEGTVFHTLMEKALPDYFRFKFATIEDLLKPKPRELTDEQHKEMRENVWDTCDNVNKKWEKFSKLHKEPKFHLELKIQLTNDIYGTADVVFVGENLKTGKTDVVVIDYKYGRGVVVVADENLQAICYLLGAINTLNIQNVGQCVSIIAQVRLEGGWSDFSIKTESDRDYWTGTILNIVDVAKKIYTGDLPLELHAGSHCRFCKCLPVCPENKKKHFDEIVETATELDLLVDAEVTPKSISDMVEALSIDQRVEVFKKAAAIEDFLAAIKLNLKSLLETGSEHPDIKIIKTNGRRKWVDDSQTVANTLIKFGIDDPWNKKLIGITEVERKLGKNKKVVDSLTEKGEGKTEVVLASDKRAAVQVSGMQELPE